ncbi:MAG: hypothetical protein A3K19_09265 [Lentisphaerae bacterium RIFOXYB12_FULL_65_16]|nr:MAG: hypothetical protein A3K18_14615 [Lentisphaerae bacterium RIFOXYA12_64_32]OGV90375.1 MAG: hypothetical protein A3K19_09265 [Lentisphaerae bacterium RIFOXYB12_FULL_65_16]
MEAAIIAEAFLQNAPEAFLVLDRDLRVAAANEAALSLFSLDAKTVAGRTLAECIPDVAPFMDQVATVVRTAQPQFLGDIAVPGSDDSLRVSLKVFKAGDGCGVIATDVSELRQAVDEARQFNQFLQQVISSACVWVSVLDRDLRVVIWNRAAEVVTGHVQAEVIGQAAVWQKLLPVPEQREKFLGRLRDVLDGESLEGQETVILNRSGDERVVSWYCRGVRDDNDAIIGIMSVGLDITARRRLERQLMHAQKMEAVGALAGGVAQDFNATLMNIFGDADIALHALPQEHPAHEPLQSILAAAHRASDLTRQLLLFSRRDPGAVHPLNINRTIQGMTRMLSRLLGKHIQVLPVLAPDLLEIQANEAHIEQVVLNLCTNARDAMPDGGRLSVITQNVHLEPGNRQNDPSARPGHFVCLTVVDTGRGMPPDIQAHIFEPFFTTKAAGQGTGLGLSVVYGIVQHMNGWISVSSRVGQGTVFDIYLPAAQPAPGQMRSGTEPNGEHTAVEAWRGQGETVLLLEDDPYVMRSLLGILQTSGYHVRLVSSVAEARQQMAQGPGQIRLVICGTALPGNAGPQFAGDVRSRFPDLPVLLVTGYPGKPAGEPLPAVFPLLDEPFSLFSVCRKIRSTLAGNVSPGPGTGT